MLCLLRVSKTAFFMLRSKNGAPLYRGAFFLWLRTNELIAPNTRIEYKNQASIPNKKYESKPSILFLPGAVLSIEFALYYYAIANPIIFKSDRKIMYFNPLLLLILHF